MANPTYATESQVYEETGLSSTFIQSYGSLTSAQVTTLINNFILKAEGKVKQLLGIPHTAHRELHLGTDEDDEFSLGTDDELAYLTQQTKNCLENAFACYFGTRRTKVPYPKNAELCFEENDFVKSNCNITEYDGALLTTNASAGDTQISVSNTNSEKFQEGNRVFLKDDSHSEYLVIDEVIWSSGVIKFTAALKYGYTTVANAKLVGPLVSGDRLMKLTFTGSGYARFPNTNYRYILKNIDIFEFFSGRFKCDDVNAVITIRLYDKDGNYNYITVTFDKTNTWYIKHYDLDDEFTGNISWEDKPLYYIEFHADRACNLWIANINFNDGWFVTIPQGILCIAHKSSDEPPAYMQEFFVTYTYDPFKHKVPDDIIQATAKLAGAELLNYLIGIRQTDIAFRLESDTLITKQDRETLFVSRSRLISEAKELLSGYGYGFEFGVVPGE